MTMDSSPINEEGIPCVMFSKDELMNEYLTLVDENIRLRLREFKWTPVSTPPSEDGDYMITWDNGVIEPGVCFATFKKGKWDEPHTIKVLAWAYLPEPYKGE